ncbi:AraC family transcriptional regulator [Bradyrhizobium sp. CB1650]|uniref:helix-turn-helix transcriptional regulator n=1 Tax=Bradyrhizobium sp. CB1650 TaxID=3039153 RepID=UPI00325F97EE
MRAVRSPPVDVVRATIAASLRHGDATLDRTARALKISVRTLQRHLGRMGTSHSEMLAEVRLEMACRLLAESSKRLSDIARFLGYSNPSSFSRTFVRLMRVRPVAYRRQQLARQHRQGRQRRKLNAIND